MTTLMPPTNSGLNAFPPYEKWDDWREVDPRSLPNGIEHRYTLVPTVCFNCEAACGLLAYVDKDSFEVRKFEGNPLHPASRGRTCAKGPATINQVTNPDRILYPLRRVGKRGEGKWERTTWDVALKDIASRVGTAIDEGRQNEITYHVGRPGEDMYTERVLQCWGIDGHNSHTNVCSAAARTGYSLWMGMDRPNPDHEKAKFILMLSSHLESGHFFNPHAQRIIDGKLEHGLRMAVIDPRLSNTASSADYWLSPYPGTEAGLLLTLANYLIQTNQIDRSFMERWVNWREFLQDQEYFAFLKDKELLKTLPRQISFNVFIDVLKELYGAYTPEWAEEETGVPAKTIVQVAEEIARAGTAFASHVWRSAASAHLGGWMVARALFLLNVLTGSVGTEGGTLPNYWTKFVPRPPSIPDPPKTWNENHFPQEYPLAHFEMSFLLPHILKNKNKRLEVYISRVHNPVWTNPDGFSWIEMLADETKVGMHVALTPVWCETAQFADYVLPTGLGPERHDLHSYETHASQWIGFRQPVGRVARERAGQSPNTTLGTNPGEVWEENEFWIELSWHLDPDGSRKIRQHFESPYRPGQKITIHEYYQWVFENSVPGLPEAAAKMGLTPLEYMQRIGAFELTQDVYNKQETLVSNGVTKQDDQEVSGGFLWSASPPPKKNYRPDPGPFLDDRGQFRVGILKDGKALQGFPTPSGLLEFFSTTLKEWGWKEYALPIYPRSEKERKMMPHITSQVHPSRIDHTNNEYPLLPTFRLPALIHTRTNGAKWLYEISHTNPVWVHPSDAQRINVQTNDLVKVETEIGYFVDKVWVTEAIRPGVIACSHHLGRWQIHEDHGSDRWTAAVVDIQHTDGKWHMQQIRGVRPFKGDPDSERIWWSDAGVHQNLTFPVQADPISGQHCWHQKVRVTKATPDVKYGDVMVDTQKSFASFKRWLEMTRPAPGPSQDRRPYWLLRPLKPTRDSYKLVKE
jgi:anaerobic selenocysteine-containing dehydrogenase